MAGLCAIKRREKDTLSRENSEEKGLMERMGVCMGTRKRLDQ